MLPLQVVVNHFTIQLEEVEELVCRASSQVCFLATSWPRVCLLLLNQIHIMQPNQCIRSSIANPHWTFLLWV